MILVGIWKCCRFRQILSALGSGALGFAVRFSLILVRDANGRTEDTPESHISNRPVGILVCSGDWSAHVSPTRMSTSLKEPNIYVLCYCSRIGALGASVYLCQ